MGHGAFDDTRQVLKLEQPSIETTKHLISEMDSHDLLLHVGDLSYADGYEPIVGFVINIIIIISMAIQSCMCMDAVG